MRRARGQVVAMARSARRGAAAAFTLVELLIVVGVIGLLLSIILVAGNSVLATARENDTIRLLQSISVGLEQFNKDFGHYPPLLNENEQKQWGAPGSPDTGWMVVADGKGLQQGDIYDEASTDPKNPVNCGPRLPGEQSTTMDRSFYNVYSLAVHLLGVGDLNGDGVEVYDDPATPEVDHNEDDGVDGPGFRDPGRDRSWGGADGREGHEDGGSHNPPKDGRVYGPYADLGNTRNLQRVPGGASGADANYEGLYRLVDRYGSPIRYYRSYPLRNEDGELTMHYTPVETRSRESLESVLLESTPSYEDRQKRLEVELADAPYVLLSVGRDGKSGHVSFDDLENLNDDEKDALLKSVSDNVRYTP